MPHFQTLANSLLSTLTSKFNTEGRANDSLCQYFVRQSHAASREVSYYGTFHCTGLGINSNNIDTLISSTIGFSKNDSLPLHIDITLSGSEIWLIESKLQPYGNSEFDWNFCKSGNVHKNLESNNLKNGRIFLTPIYQRNGVNFYNDQHEGKIWADTLRLIEVKSHMSKTTPQQRLFLLFYIGRNAINAYCGNLPAIFQEFQNIQFLATINPRGLLDIWPNTRECSFTCHQYNVNNSSVQSHVATQNVVPFITGNNLQHIPILIEVAPN
jgi:hypothetical protein